LSHVLDTVEDGIYIVNQEGVVTFANRATERIMGVTHDEMSRSRHDDPRWQFTNLEGKPFPPEQEPFARVMTTGEPVYDVEKCMVRADGSRTFISINAAPLHDAKGAVIGEVASLTDITTRKQAQDALR